MIHLAKTNSQQWTSTYLRRHLVTVEPHEKYPGSRRTSLCGVRVNPYGVEYTPGEDWICRRCLKSLGKGIDSS